MRTRLTAVTKGYVWTGSIIQFHDDPQTGNGTQFHRSDRRTCMQSKTRNTVKK